MQKKQPLLLILILAPEYELKGKKKNGAEVGKMDQKQGSGRNCQGCEGKGKQRQHGAKDQLGGGVDFSPLKIFIDLPLVQLIYELLFTEFISCLLLLQVQPRQLTIFLNTHTHNYIIKSLKSSRPIATGAGQCNVPTCTACTPAPPQFFQEAGSQAAEVTKGSELPRSSRSHVHASLLMRKPACGQQKQCRGVSYPELPHF